MGRSLHSRCFVAAGVILLGCDPGGGGADAGDAAIDAPSAAPDGAGFDGPAPDGAVEDADEPDGSVPPSDGGEVDGGCAPCGTSDECVAYPGCAPACDAPLYSVAGTECGEGGTCDGAGTCSAGPVTCGDGIRHRGEDAREGCDDGNLALGDACSPVCIPTPFVVAQREGEIDYGPGPRIGVGINAAGEALYVWTADIRTGTGAEIRFRRFSAVGVPFDPLGAPRTLAAGLGVGVDPHPVTIGLGSGWVVAWEDAAIDGSALGIAYAIVRADGTVGIARRANTTILLRQREPALATYGTGFVVAWTDEAGLIDGGSASRVVMRRFGATGLADGPELRVEPSTSAELGEPTLASIAGGPVLVAWTDRGSSPAYTRSVRARRYASGAFVDGTSFVVDAAEAHSPAVAGLGLGEFVIAWTSRATDATGDVHARVVHATGAPLVGSTVAPVGMTDAPETHSAAVHFAAAEWVVCWEEGAFNTSIACGSSPGAVLPAGAMIVIDPLISASLDRISGVRASDGIWLSFGVHERAPVSGAIRAVWGYFLPPD